MNKTTFLDSIGATLPALSTGRPDARCWDYFTRKGNVVMLGSGDAISGGYTEIVWLECPNFRERLRYDHVMECDSVVGRKREFYFLIRSNGWSDNNNVSWEVTKDSVVYEIIPETFKVVGDKGFVKLNLSKPISVLEV